MFQQMTADEAIGLIKDGDTIAINSFLTIANPQELHNALARRVRETKTPKNLTLLCAAGYGGWTTDSYAEPYTEMGAVAKVVAGHFASMPLTAKLISENKLEGYNLPLGVISHMIRAAASKKPGVITNIGLNLSVDPEIAGPALNERSKEKWVERIQLHGETFLFYKTPKIDIAFIQGTTADYLGNISFERECATLDALALAQATKANGGKVIVQVERLSTQHQRPRNVIVPGILIDAIVVCSNQQQIFDQPNYNPSYSGDVYVPPQEMDLWIQLMQASQKEVKKRTQIHEIIAYRAYLELSKGNIVNIGIGIAEGVALIAAKTGLLSDIALTVESGAIGGLPATGHSFGATIGADTIYDMSQQFDFYDGGGLDICFVGALEIDAKGNVNAHYKPGRITGLGGLANITQSTRKVIFCTTFSAIGMKATITESSIHIDEEGSVPKFVPEISAISFSAINALKNNQEVLYITERCVFRLEKDGLVLCEIANGIDLQKDILKRLPFPVKITKSLQPMPFKLL